jgi:hypothetical protein
MAAPCPAPGITAAVVLAIALAAAGVVIATQPPGLPQRGLLATLSGPRGQQEFSAAFSPDVKTLAVVTYGGVSLWDVAARRWTATLTAPGCQQGGVPVGFSPDGKTLAEFTGTTCLWDLATGRETSLPALHPLQHGRRVQPRRQDAGRCRLRAAARWRHRRDYLRVGRSRQAADRHAPRPPARAT